MKIKDYNFSWACCPNCGKDDKLNQKRTVNFREVHCGHCDYYMQEGFLTFLLVSKGGSSGKIESNIIRA